jgi:hypothetical protein
MPPSSLLWSRGPFGSALFPSAPNACALCHACFSLSSSFPLFPPCSLASACDVNPSAFHPHRGPFGHRSFFQIWSPCHSVSLVLTSPTPVWNSVPCPIPFGLHPYPRYDTRGLFVSASVLAGCAIVILHFPSISSMLSSLRTSVPSMSPMLKNSRGSFLLGGHTDLTSCGPPRSPTDLRNNPLSCHIPRTTQSPTDLRSNTHLRHLAEPAGVRQTSATIHSRVTYRGLPRVRWTSTTIHSHVTYHGLPGVRRTSAAIHFHIRTLRAQHGLGLRP